MADHANRPSFDQMATAAREAREQQATARREEQERTTGEALLEFENLFGNDKLDHDTMMARLQAAIAGLRGETAPSGAPSTTPLSDDEQEILELLREGTLVKTEFGAWRDKRFTRLRKDVEQGREGEGAPSTPSDDTDKEPPAKNRKKATPSKDEPAEPAKAPAKEDAPASPPDKAASAWTRIKQAAKTAAQNAQQ